MGMVERVSLGIPFAQVRSLSLAECDPATRERVSMLLDIVVRQSGPLSELIARTCRDLSLSRSISISPLTSENLGP